MTPNSHLYSALLRFGNINKLNVKYNGDKFLNDICQFSDSWVQYNKAKSFINREGLSITSLDGGLSGIPDLDSIPEYNIANNTCITEADIFTPTDVYKYAEPYTSFIKQHLLRAHVIRMLPGGFFPIHRDNNSINVEYFRLFVPIRNCNPPNMFFMFGDMHDTITFDHGTVYFINTSIQHLLFNPSMSTSYFIVLNVQINEESINAVLQHFAAR